MIRGKVDMVDSEELIIRAKYADLMTKNSPFPVEWMLFASCLDCEDISRKLREGFRKDSVAIILGEKNAKQYNGLRGEKLFRWVDNLRHRMLKGEL